MKSVEELNLPEDQLYFSIGELAEMLDVEAHTLRYWEEEFELLEPGSTPGGQRRYQRGDIELLLKIKYLLKQEQYTLEGARRKLNQWQAEPGRLKSAREISSLCSEALEEISRFVESEL